MCYTLVKRGDLTLEWLCNLRNLKNTTTETYKSIAEKTKIPQTTIEKLFSGRTRDPKLFMIKEVVHCLGYTLDDLLETNSTNSSKTILSAENKEILMMLNNLNSFGYSKAKDYVNLLLLDKKNIKTSQVTLESQGEIAAFGADGTEGSYEPPEEETT